MKCWHAHYHRCRQSWSLPTVELLHTLSNQGEEYTTLAWSPTGDILASDENSINLWDPTSGQLLATVENAGSISEISWAPDRFSIASANYDGTVRFWGMK